MKPKQTLARYRRLNKLFGRIQAIVSARCPRLAKIQLRFCPELGRQRKDIAGLRGRRVYMHVECTAGAICTVPEASRLSEGHLLGLLLHEFGHLATGRGDHSADAWVLVMCGIPVLYRGPLVLEWVNPANLS